MMHKRLVVGEAVLYREIKLFRQSWVHESDAGFAEDWRCIFASTGLEN